VKKAPVRAARRSLSAWGQGMEDAAGRSPDNYPGRESALLREQL